MADVDGGQTSIKSWCGEGGGRRGGGGGGFHDTSRTNPSRWDSCFHWRTALLQTSWRWARCSTRRGALTGRCTAPWCPFFAAQSRGSEAAGGSSSPPTRWPGDEGRNRGSVERGEWARGKGKRRSGEDDRWRAYMGKRWRCAGRGRGGGAGE